jgi:excisionase family DNA binding protein
MTLDTEKAAEYLHCSPSRIAELVGLGQLRAARIGRGFVFKTEWLDRFLEEEADRHTAEIRAGRCVPARTHGESRSRKRALPDLAQYA